MDETALLREALNAAFATLDEECLCATDTRHLTAWLELMLTERPHLVAGREADIASAAARVRDADAFAAEHPPAAPIVITYTNVENRGVISASGGNGRA